MIAMLKWIFFTVTVIWIVVMWCVVIYALRRGWGPYLRSKRRRKTRVRCSIKARENRQETDPLTQQPLFIHKVLIFQCEDGVDRDYEVHEDIFDWVEDGDEGTLVYQGDLFVDFEAARPRQDTEKLYQHWTRS